MIKLKSILNEIGDALVAPYITISIPRLGD